MIHFIHWYLYSFAEDNLGCSRIRQRGARGIRTAHRQGCRAGSRVRRWVSASYEWRHRAFAARHAESCWCGAWACGCVCAQTRTAASRREGSGNTPATHSMYLSSFFFRLTFCLSVRCEGGWEGGWLVDAADGWGSCAQHAGTSGTAGGAAGIARRRQ